MDTTIYASVYTLDERPIPVVHTRTRFICFLFILLFALLRVCQAFTSVLVTANTHTDDSQDYDDLCHNMYSNNHVWICKHKCCYDRGSVGSRNIATKIAMRAY